MENLSRSTIIKAAHNCLYKIRRDESACLSIRPLFAFHSTHLISILPPLLNRLCLYDVNILLSLLFQSDG